MGNQTHEIQSFVSLPNSYMDLLTPEEEEDEKHFHSNNTNYLPASFKIKISRKFQNNLSYKLFYIFFQISN